MRTRTMAAAAISETSVRRIWHAHGLKHAAEKLVTHSKPSRGNGC